MSKAVETARANKRRRERVAALDRELATLVDADVISLDEAEQRARDNERIAKLPPDLVERVNDGMGLDEAESVVKQRGERIATWAEKVRAGLETFARMAGNPVPAELKEHLSPPEIANLSAILGALEPQEEPNG